MKQITITLFLTCPDDIPLHVTEWMRENVLDHALREFGSDYEPRWTNGYPGPPLVDAGATVTDEADVRFVHRRGEKE